MQSLRVPTAIALLACLAGSVLAAPALAISPFSDPASSLANRTYHNPILPGWHSDPSCAFAAHLDNTLFCATSSFLDFPGLPIHASHDFVHWKLASNAINRATQVPGFSTSLLGQGLGIFAPTLRLHEGIFYLITVFINPDTPDSAINFSVFTSTDPRDETTWSDAIHIDTPGGLRAIDPDIFWDDDGRIVMAFANSPVKASYIDLATGKASAPFDLWAGTGGIHAEGPHLLRKDGYYYLIVAEGGTQLGHETTVARSRTLEGGNWEQMPSNPLVSAAGTDNFFQTVGHSDLFQDGQGNWWGVALTTRGGPANYNASTIPMGRETALYPVRWASGDWPSAETVKGTMTGPLPPLQPDVKGVTGPSPSRREAEDFKPGSALPLDWVHIRPPVGAAADYAISSSGHADTLRLTGTRNNLTNDPGFDVAKGLAFVARRQEATILDFSVDLRADFGRAAGDEAGITVFNAQDHHIDLGVVYLEEKGKPGKCVSPYLRARATQFGGEGQVRVSPIPADVVVPLPKAWLKNKGAAGPVVRLTLATVNATHYKFSASPADGEKPSGTSRVSLGVWTSALLTTDGAGTGAIVGVYATTNGAADRTVQAYFSRWRYDPVSQETDYGVSVPADEFVI